MLADKSISGSRQGVSFYCPKGPLAAPGIVKCSGNEAYVFSRLDISHRRHNGAV
jgi:hypothetical protein